MADREQHRDSDDPDYGSLTIEDDPGGTTDPADLAGTATADDADATQEPSVSAADDVEQSRD